MTYRSWGYTEPREVTCPICGQQVRLCLRKDSPLRPLYPKHRAYSGKFSGGQCPSSGVEVGKLVSTVIK